MQDHFPAVKQSGNVNNNIQTGATTRWDELRAAVQTATHRQQTVWPFGLDIASHCLTRAGGGFKMSNGGFDPNFVSMHFGQMALCHDSGAGSTCARAPKLAQACTTPSVTISALRPMDIIPNMCTNLMLLATVQQSWQWAARYSLVAGCQFIDPRHGERYLSYLYWRHASQLVASLVLQNVFLHGQTVIPV